MSEEKHDDLRPHTFFKMDPGIQGNCPRCGKPMRISKGMNRCPNCGYIFKSNLKVK